MMSIMSRLNSQLILSRLEGAQDLWQMKEAIKAELLRPRYEVEDMHKLAPQLMEDMGLATRLRNQAFFACEEIRAAEGYQHSVPGQGDQEGLGSQPPCPPVDVDLNESGVELAVVAAARRLWQRRVTERLNQLSGLLQHPLAKAEQEVEIEDPTLQPSERIAVAKESADQYVDQAVYTTDDLLEAIISIQKDPQGLNRGMVPEWGLVPLALQMPSLEAIRHQFADLHLQHRQVGLDDALEGWYAEKRLEEGSAAIAGGSVAACRRFARYGVPVALRPSIWMAALGVKVAGHERDYFEKLCCQVERRELLTDMLIRSDVHDIADDARYFVFEEALRAVMQAGSRDPALGPMCVITPHPVVQGMGKDFRTHGPYPPCGVVPFAGLVLYAAPLCYLYSNLSEIYFCFRAMYARHFCRLHVISSHSGTEAGLPALCRFFEDLLQEHDPIAFFHLIQIDCPPLRLVFPWLVHAFVGFLEVDQVLLLWDRIIGFDSLLLLPLLAVAILSFRREDILEASCPEDVQDVFEDFSEIRVIPLLQKMLFLDN